MDQTGGCIRLSGFKGVTALPPNKPLGGPQSWIPMASETITIARAELTADVSRALIDSLNAELTGVYSEPGATHFHLDPEEVADGRGIFLVVYREGNAGRLRRPAAPRCRDGRTQADVCISHRAREGSGAAPRGFSRG